MVGNVKSRIGDTTHLHKNDHRQLMQHDKQI